MLQKERSYFSVRGRTTAHPQCNRLQLRVSFALAELIGTVPLL